MKIGCTCGGIIVDQTDGLPNKAYVFSDRDWHAFWDQIEEAMRASEKHGYSYQLLDQIIDPSQQAWERHDCGRLFFQKDGSNMTNLFRPDDGQAKKVFDRSGFATLSTPQKP